MAQKDHPLPVGTRCRMTLKHLEILRREGRQLSADAQHFTILKAGIVGRDIPNADGIYLEGDVGYSIRYDGSSEVCHVGQDELEIYEVVPKPSSMPPSPPQHTPTQDEPTCKHCGGKVLGRTKCSRCKNVYYCSKECQVDDWKIGGHRELCSSMATVRIIQKNSDKYHGIEKKLDKNRVSDLAEWGVRFAAAQKREEELFPDFHSRTRAPMIYFFKNKDSPQVVTLLKKIGAWEEVQARGWPGTMPLIVKLLRCNVCNDENLALLFGDPELVRSAVIQNEQILKDF